YNRLPGGDAAFKDRLLIRARPTHSSPIFSGKINDGCITMNQMCPTVRAVPIPSMNSDALRKMIFFGLRAAAKDNDLMAVCQKHAAQHLADKPCAAGDEYAHNSHSIARHDNPSSIFAYPYERMMGNSL